MEYLRLAFSTAYKIANLPVDLFGYTITFWQIFLYAAFGGLVIWFLRNLME